MIIGILPDPTNHPDWPQIEAFLRPAAERGGVPILEDGEALVAVYDGDLKGAATIRRTVEGFGEVVLVGGIDHREWIDELDETIAQIMRTEGMCSVRAYGRRGWVRVLKRWTVIGEAEGMTGYERAL